MGVTVGIDLGTTNSAIAFCHSSSRIDLFDVNGARTIPSVVAFSDQGVLVGEPALRQIQQNPRFTFQSVKRLMGQRYNPHEDWGPQVTEGEDGFIGLIGPDRVYSPAEVSGYIVQELLTAAEPRLGETPDGAVIAVPAYFTQEARTATKRAAVYAGLDPDRIEIRDEPTMAALAYGLDKQEKYTRVAVYDLGGGTFDFSLLDIGRGRDRTVAKNGNSRLGGNDFDARIEAYCYDFFYGEYQEELRGRQHCMVRTRNASEQAKKDLTNKHQTQVKAPDIVTGSDGKTLSLDVPLSRGDMVELTDDLIRQTMDICQRVLNDAGRTVADVDTVLMVGGMTRMPAIRERVSAFFGANQLDTSHSPDEVVAMGAAVAAASIDKRLGAFKHQNVSAMPIGFRSEGGGMFEMIPGGTELPFSKAIRIGPASEEQSSMTIDLYEGDKPRVRHNAFICAKDVEISPDGEYELLFAMDENEALKVSISDGTDEAILYDMLEEGAKI